MADVRYEDLYAASVSENAEKLLVGRLDASVRGVTAIVDNPRRVTGIIGRCANTGYVILRLAGSTVGTIDLATLNGMAQPLALDITVPGGQTLAVSCLSTTGTALCAVTLAHERAA